MALQIAALARNTTPSDEIARHILATYTTLRWGLGILALLFPLLLVGYGWFRGVDLQPSLSAYYYAATSAVDCVWFPTRAVFVGLLCAIAVGLYLYKGFTNLENLLLNVAAICGVAVAWVPEKLSQEQVDACAVLAPVLAQQTATWVHWLAAVLLFVCLGAVAWFCAEKTLAYLPAQHKHRAEGFRRTYKTLGVMMVVGPLLAVAVANLLDAKYTVIALEAAGIWVFAAYWLVKSRELGLSHAVEKAVQDHMPPNGGAQGGAQGAKPGELDLGSAQP